MSVPNKSGDWLGRAVAPMDGLFGGGGLFGPVVVVVLDGRKPGLMAGDSQCLITSKTLVGAWTSSFSASKRMSE